MDLSVDRESDLLEPAVDDEVEEEVVPQSQAPPHSPPPRPRASKDILAPSPRGLLSDAWLSTPRPMAPLVPLESLMRGSSRSSSSTSSSMISTSTSSCAGTLSGVVGYHGVSMSRGSSSSDDAMAPPAGSPPGLGVPKQDKKLRQQRRAPTKTKKRAVATSLEEISSEGSSQAEPIDVHGNTSF